MLLFSFLELTGGLLPCLGQLGKRLLELMSELCELKFALLTSNFPFL